MVVNVHRAKTQQLSRLFAHAEAGEDVVIARRDEPVVRFVSCKPPSKRQPPICSKGKSPSLSASSIRCPRKNSLRRKANNRARIAVYPREPSVVRRQRMPV